MKHVWSLLCAALVAVALVPMPAYADVVFPDSDDRTQADDGDLPAREDGAQVGLVGCSNAAAAARTGAEGTVSAGLAAAVGCLSVAATTGIVYVADKRPE